MNGRHLGFTADFDRIILINTICCLWFHVFSTVVYVLSLMIMFLNAKHDNEAVLFCRILNFNVNSYIGKRVRRIDENAFNYRNLIFVS